jgi:glycosyltransferase involved in cell wall biosynthesis
MNVLFVSTWYPYPPDNGSKIRAYHLLRALGQRHRLTLLSFSFGTAQPGQVAPQVLGCESLDVVRRDPFVRSQVARSLRFLSPTPIVERPIAEMTSLVSRKLNQNRFDVVIASTTAMSPYALLAGNTPKLLEEHNAWSRWAWQTYQAQGKALQRLRHWVSWQKRRRYEARVYRRFDRISMVSEEDADVASSLLRGAGDRVHVIPNGVDCEHNHPGLAQPVPNTLIFNGALTYSANHDAMRYFLSEVYPRIRREEPAMSLTITGPTADVDLSALLLDGSVHLSGHVEDVRPLVAGASVCVVPIRQGGGTRLKILEAMALGTPVVATTKAAEGLAVTPEEHILIADEPTGFAAQVLRLLRDSALRKRLARDARRLVEGRYDWPTIGRQFTHLVEMVARERVVHDLPIDRFP